MLDTGCWMLDTSWFMLQKMLNTRYWILDARWTPTGLCRKDAAYHCGSWKNAFEFQIADTI
jgi:hypothetical protein